MRISIIFAAAVIAGGGLVAALQGSNNSKADDPQLKADLAMLQGKWEATFPDENGRILAYKVKEIQGNTERVTWYSPDQKVQMVNAVEFQLERRGAYRCFSYFNGRVVEGPNQGQQFPDGSYIYAIRDGTWVEISEQDGSGIFWHRIAAGESQNQDKPK